MIDVKAEMGSGRIPGLKPDIRPDNPAGVKRVVVNLLLNFHTDQTSPVRMDATRTLIKSLGGDPIAVNDKKIQDQVEQALDRFSTRYKNDQQVQAMVNSALDKLIAEPAELNKVVSIKNPVPVQNLLKEQFGAELYEKVFGSSNSEPKNPPISLEGK